jgi:predicted dehydrogenase
MFKPKILLIGAGRFGKNHLRILSNWAEKGRIDLTGVVVKTEKSKKELQRKCSAPVFTNLSPAILKLADAAIIVAPSHAHFALVKQCLRYTNVFVEKPLAESSKAAQNLLEEARRQRRVLMVGHIFRFHPVTEKLKLLFSGLGTPRRINGAFISPSATYCDENPFLEELHLFDVIDYLFEQKPKIFWGRQHGLVANACLRYPGSFDADLEIGWADKEKKRFLNFEFGNKKFYCDFVESRIIFKNGKQEKIIHCPFLVEPLEKELKAFLAVLAGKKIDYPDAKIGMRIVGIAEQASRSLKIQKSKIAIIGGGIFGTTCALMLSKYLSVTLFEKKSDLLGEASLVNQYRHHYGYHYPRSEETIKEIAVTRKEFERFYRPAIVSGFPSYYCVSKIGSLVSANKFLEVCRRNKLPYKKEYPPEDWLNRKSVSLSVRTPESVYDYQRLKALINQRIKQSGIVLRLGCSVSAAELLPFGQKSLTVNMGNKKIKENFDYVINATYARYNQFCRWLNFPEKDLKLRQKEIIVVRLPGLKKCAVTIVDGPFATVVPLGRESGLYTFGDVPLSIRKNFSSKNDDILKKSDWHLPVSKWPEMRKRCAQWFPFLKDAQYVKSMFTILPTEMISDKNDDRPTDVVRHGFGCWSIFSGKIEASVSAAHTLVKNIINE